MTVPYEEGGQAQRQNVQDDADDDLVNPVLDGEQSQKQRPGPRPRGARR